MLALSCDVAICHLSAKIRISEWKAKKMMKFLICFVGDEQFSKNGLQHTHTQWSVSNGFLVAYGENQRSLFAKRGKVNFANRSKSCKSVLPRKGRKRCWLISNQKKRIENAYTQDGRIANSSERPVAG